MEKQIYINYDIIKGLLFLILAICGNFIAETLSCPIQKLLTENIFVKHIVTVLILYFTTGIIQDSHSPIHPYDTLKLCLTAYIIFLFFTKMDIYFTCISFIIIAIIYINFRILGYYLKLKPNDKGSIELHKKINVYLFKLLYIVLIIGFLKYFFYINKKNRNLISLVKFLFDLKKCYN